MDDGVTDDRKTGAASRAALVPKLAADGQRVFSVHFPFPGIGERSKQGDKFVWVAETPHDRRIRENYRAHRRNWATGAVTR